MTGNPVKDVVDIPQLREALTAACAEVGINGSSARLIHHYANAVYLLPHANAVARLGLGPLSGRYAQTSVAMTRWLVAEHDFPATAPLPVPAVVIDSQTTVTFWTYYPQPVNAEPSSVHLGRLVRWLHGLPPPSVALPEWQPLASLETSLRDPCVLDVITRTDQAWLLERISQVRAELSTLYWPLGYGHIHGDAWVGNLMWNTAAGPDAVVLGDWDAICHGPREIDLIPSWHAAHRYGRGPAWARAFADTYGYDLTSWPGYQTLFTMRDLIQLAGPLRRAAREPTFAQALHQRINGIKTADTHTTWRAF